MAIDISKIIELIKDPDLRIKIANLYGENIQLKEENHKLRGKLDKKEKDEKTQSKLNFKDNHYYLDNDGPFCTKCWDVDKNLVRLHKRDTGQGLINFSCPNCKTNTETGEYIQPSDIGGTHW